MTRSKSLALAIFAGLASTLAIAASPVSTAITARQTNFKKMGGAMKALKDNLAYGAISKAEAVAAARMLAATGRAQAGLFPSGSGPSSGLKTDALPAVWTNRAAFDGQMKTFIAQADKLVVAANSGKIDAINAQFKAVGGACGSCHRQFRADN